LANLNSGAMLTCCTDSRFAFLLDERTLEAAALALHEEFFSDPDPAIFVRNRYTSAPLKSRINASVRTQGILKANPIAG
jgi:hypothetical protein